MKRHFIYRAANGILFYFAMFPAHAANAPPSPAIASPVDCAVIASAMKINSPMQMTIGSFGANCDWKKLGANISLTQNKAGSITGFGPPTYASDGVHANFRYSTDFFGTDGHFVGGRSYLCTLQKQHKIDKDWEPIECTLSFIAN